MVKQVAFGKKDEELIKKIISFQEEKGIQSFVEAVRQLCNEALECMISF